MNEQAAAILIVSLFAAGALVCFDHSETQRLTVVRVQKWYRRRYLGRAYDPAHPNMRRRFPR